MGGVITEEKDISRSQYLDFVYSQSGTLYDLIPQAPHPSTDPPKPPAEVPVDGVVGSIQSPSIAKPAKQTQTATTSIPKVSAEVNSIQSTQTLSNKKKGKNRNKKPRNQQETPRPTNSDNNKGKRKAKYPYLLCGGDHFSKEFPRRDEISQFLKSNPTPAVLTDPFPSQQQLIDHMSNQGNSSSLEEIRSISRDTIHLQTRS